MRYHLFYAARFFPWADARFCIGRASRGEAIFRERAFRQTAPLSRLGSPKHPVQSVIGPFAASTGRAFGHGSVASVAYNSKAVSWGQAKMIQRAGWWN
jgi:hypothetical protein